MCLATTEQVAMTLEMEIYSHNIWGIWQLKVSTIITPEKRMGQFKVIVTT